MLNIEKNLTPRLKMIADLVPQCTSLCDIGTDHGYVAIYLAKKGIAKKVIAADIKKGPLYQAEKNIALFNAGDIGKAINIENRTPSICRVMEYFKSIYPNYEIIHEPKSGFSTTKEIKFYMAKTAIQGYMGEVFVDNLEKPTFSYVLLRNFCFIDGNL